LFRRANTVHDGTHTVNGNGHIRSPPEEYMKNSIYAC
jgi:hypothetical protein